MLELFGFRINRTKSFTSGRFFESCGKHYWGSSDVTPAYQKKPPRSNRAERISAHNRLIRWALRQGAGVSLDPTVQGTCALLRRGHEEFSGPIGPESDTYFQVPYGHFRISCGRAVVKCWRAVPKYIRVRQAAAYAYWLRLAEAGPLSQGGRNVDSDTKIELLWLDRKPVESSGDSDGRSLVLSETSQEFTYCVRKERMSISDIQVDATWAC